MTNTHILTTSQGRRCTVTVTEDPDRVRLGVRFDRYGSMGDEAEFAAWLQPIIEKYDADPRPVVMDNPLSGEQAIVGDGVAVITKPKTPNN